MTKTDSFNLSSILPEKKSPYASLNSPQKKFCYSFSVRTRYFCHVFSAKYFFWMFPKENEKGVKKINLKTNTGFGKNEK
jgi:hypothetical protein